MTTTPPTYKSPPVELSPLRIVTPSIEQPAPPPASFKALTRATLLDTFPTTTSPTILGSHRELHSLHLPRLLGHSIVGNMLSATAVLLTLWFGYVSVNYAREGVEYSLAGTESGHKQLVIAQVSYCQLNAYMANDPVCVKVLNGSIYGGFSGGSEVYLIEGERRLCLMEWPFRVSNAKWVGVLKDLLAMKLVQWILLLVCAVCMVRFWRSIFLRKRWQWRRAFLIVSLLCILRLPSWMTYIQIKINTRCYVLALQRAKKNSTW